MKNIVLICYMFVIHSISSAQIAYFTTTDLLKTSQFIVEGKVVKVTPRWDKERKFIYSFIDVRIKRVLKGNIKDSVITLKELGGSIENFTTSSQVHPIYRTGEVVLVFLNLDNIIHKYYTNDFWLGKFLITEENGRKKLVRQMREIDSLC